MATQFNALKPATLKFNVPINAAGNIAVNEETAVDTKQISWAIVKGSYVTSRDVTPSDVWQNYNAFLNELVDTVFNTAHVPDDNKVTIEFETWEG